MDKSLAARNSRNRKLWIYGTLALTGLVTMLTNACSSDFVVNQSMFGSVKPYYSATTAELKQSCSLASEDTETTPILRLTTDEYSATVRQILQCQYNCLGDFGSQLDQVLAALPTDIRRDSISTYIRFSNTDQSMSAERIQGYHEVAQYVAQKFETLPTDRKFLFSFLFDSCYNDSGNLPETCIDKMLNGFGLKAFRRPLSSQQLTEIKLAMSAGSSVEEKLSKAVYFMMMSPDFIFHMESDGTRVGSWLRMDSFGVAAKVSYLFTGAPPDATTYEKAADGKIQTSQEISELVEYLRANRNQMVRDQLWKFAREWLNVSNSALTVDAKNAAYAAPEISVEPQRESLRRDARNELRDMIEHFIFSTPGTYRSLLTNELSFAKTPSLSQIYRVPQWSGSGNPVPHVPGERRGLLTTAAILIPGGPISHPFQTGGLIHKHILCRDFGNQGEPQILAGLDPAAPTTLETTRTKYEKLVPRRSSCMSCHSAIEGLGMPFEMYDPFGRHRAGQEKLFNTDGSFAGQVPVNTRATALIGPHAQEVPDAVGLIDSMTTTSEPQACFAKQFLRFATARKDGLKDSCTLYRFSSKLETVSLWEAMKSFAADDWFRTKRID